MMRMWATHAKLIRQHKTALYIFNSLTQIYYRVRTRPTLFKSTRPLCCHCASPLSCVCTRRPTINTNNALHVIYSAAFPTPSTAASKSPLCPPLNTLIPPPPRLPAWCSLTWTNHHVALIAVVDQKSCSPHSSDRPITSPSEQ